MAQAYEGIRLSLRLFERRFLLLAGDAFLAALAVQVASWQWNLRWLAIGQGVPTPPAPPPFWYWGLVPLWLIACSLVGLHDQRIAAQADEAVKRVLLLGAIFLGIYLVVYFASPPQSLPRFFFVVYLIVLDLTAIPWRVAYARVFSLPLFVRRILIVGASRSGQTLERALAEAGQGACQLLGFVDDDPGQQGATIGGAPVLGAARDLLALAGAMKADDIVLAITGRMSGELFQALADCRERGFPIVRMETLYEQLVRRVPVEHIGDDWAIISTDALTTRRSFALVKRILDVAIAIAGLIVLGLVLPFLATAIYLESPGPIFYRHQRVGRGGRLFWMTKFRSMLPEADQAYGLRRAVENDVRVTRLGRFLRRTRLNELPQFWDVLRGDMSLIGPRPELPEFVAEVQGKIPFYRTRLLVKPGITGWAQVNYGYGPTVEDALLKLQYDLYYIKHWSLALDFEIILKTAGAVWRFKGL